MPGAFFRRIAVTCIALSVIIPCSRIHFYLVLGELELELVQCEPAPGSQWQLGLSNSREECMTSSSHRWKQPINNVLHYRSLCTDHECRERKPVKDNLVTFQWISCFSLKLKFATNTVIRHNGNLLNWILIYFYQDIKIMWYNWCKFSANFIHAKFCSSWIQLDLYLTYALWI